MVVALREGGEVLLERRPEHGVWGGLWCLPEFASASAAGAFIRAALHADGAATQRLAALEHGFTHFDLTINPLLVRCAAVASAAQEPGTLWYNIRTPARIGLPAPITALLGTLAQASLFDRA